MARSDESDVMGTDIRTDVTIFDDGQTEYPENQACILAANGLFHVRRLNVGGVPFAEVCERVGPGWPAPGIIPAGACRASGNRTGSR